MARAFFCALTPARGAIPRFRVESLDFDGESSITRAMLRSILIALLIILPTTALAESLTVAVSVLPQKRFVERVAGDRVNVIVVVGPGQSPATYDPSPRQMAALADADLFFSMGVPFERTWLPRITSLYPRLKPADTTAGIPRRRMASHRHGDHVHDGEPDPHLWTDPRHAAHMVRRMAEAFAVLDPAGAPIYRANAEGYLVELAALDRELRALLEPVAGGRFLVFHPSWGYFAEAYGLEQVAIETEGKAPGARSLARFIDRARAEGVKAVFVQEQFAAGSARAVAEAVDARLIQVDPLAEDYAANLRRVAVLIAEALE